MTISIMFCAICLTQCDHNYYMIYWKLLLHVVAKLVLYSRIKLFIIILFC